MFQKYSILLVVTLLLAACNSNSETFTFSGETENWSGELDVIQNENGYEKQKFELQYKGNDESSIGEISYDVNTKSGGFGADGLSLGENGTLKGGSEANPTNAKIVEDSEIEVTVEWDGNKETFTLNNN